MIDSTGFFESIRELFDEQCNDIGNFLDENPTYYKTVMVANHIFRAIGTYSMVVCSPFSTPITSALMLTSSLLYRASVERFCAFRFTVGALAGALAIGITVPAITSLVAGTALSSVGTAFMTLSRFVPLGVYAVGIVEISSKDVDAKLRKDARQTCHVIQRHDTKESLNSTKTINTRTSPPSPWKQPLTYMRENLL